MLPSLKVDAPTKHAFVKQVSLVVTVRKSNVQLLCQPTRLSGTNPFPSPDFTFQDLILTQIHCLALVMVFVLEANAHASLVSRELLVTKKLVQQTATSAVFAWMASASVTTDSELQIARKLLFKPLLIALRIVPDEVSADLALASASTESILAPTVVWFARSAQEHAL